MRRVYSGRILNENTVLPMQHERTATIPARYDDSNLLMNTENTVRSKNTTIRTTISRTTKNTVMPFVEKSFDCDSELCNQTVQLNTNKATQPTQLLAYIPFQKNKQLSTLCISFHKNTQPFRVEQLNGLYAYCVVSNDRQEQFLAIKRLKEHQSDHGIFSSLIKKIPGTNRNKNIILCGGEITFMQGEIKAWNLKSGSFSEGGLFDERNPDFQEHINKLCLPRDKYQSIAEAAYYASKFFSERGSFNGDPPAPKGLN